jgi:hypothetical protein
VSRGQRPDPAISLADVRRFRGLMTSAAPRHPGDQPCPPFGGNYDIDCRKNVCLRHGEERAWTRAFEHSNLIAVAKTTEEPRITWRN